jgi:excinuclease ABC subunit A
MKSTQKDYSKSKIIIKAGGFAPLRIQKLLFKQLEIIGEKFGFKLTDY